MRGTVSGVVASMAFVADNWPVRAALGFWLGTKLCEDYGKNPSLRIKQLAHVGFFGNAINDCFKFVRNAYGSDLRNGYWANWNLQDGGWTKYPITHEGKLGSGSYSVINNVAGLIDAGLFLMNVPEDSALGNNVCLVRNVFNLYYFWPLVDWGSKDRAELACVVIHQIASIGTTVCLFRRLMKIPVDEKIIHIFSAVNLGANLAYCVYKKYQEKSKQNGVGSRRAV